MKFRNLKPNEIDVFPKIVKEKGCMVLLYKDARCDQNILDETVGAMNWQRHHLRDNKNCIVSIWDEDKKQWVQKEDTGVESFTEKEKGLASDSFKRACFNWGIGRELYTAPFTWIPLNKGETYEYKGSMKLKKGLEFKVSHIKVDDGHITELIIVDNDGKERFNYGTKTKTKPTKKKSTKTISEDEILEIEKLISETGIDKVKFQKWLKDSFKASKIDDIPQVAYAKVISVLESKKEDK
jgi:hypothetical protein